MTSVQASPLPTRRQRGSSLIEVLIAVLILSFGLLSLGGMMSFAVQMPKLSGNRSIAIAVGADMVERMRANQAGFVAGNYTTNLTYDGNNTIPSTTTCSFAACTTSTLATMDLTTIQQQVRQMLPAGGYSIAPLSSGSTSGSLWILWQEPSSYGSFDTTSSDNCPGSASSYTNPRPRCIYIPFSL